MVASKSNYVYADGSWTGKSTGNYISEDGTATSFTMYFSNCIDIREQFIPTKIIYSCPATICYFSDGTKEVVKVASHGQTLSETYEEKAGATQAAEKDWQLRNFAHVQLP